MLFFHINEKFKTIDRAHMFKKNRPGTKFGWLIDNFQ